MFSFSDSWLDHKPRKLTILTGRKVTPGSKNLKTMFAPNARRNMGMLYTSHLTPTLKATSISNSNGFLVVRTPLKVSMDVTSVVGKFPHSLSLTLSTAACSLEPKHFDHLFVLG
jgi:hypothetical protein